jgi:hypothetical protein
VLAPFEKWLREPGIDLRQHPRKTFRYWEVEPTTVGNVLVHYLDEKNHPALLESKFDRRKVSGRVLLFTTAVDGREPPWNNLVETLNSFYTVFAKLAVGYLAGNIEEMNLNHLLTGQTLEQGVQVPLPLSPRFANYTLSRAEKPDLAGASFLALVPRPADENELRVTQAAEPSNYSLLGTEGGKRWLTGFSLNLPAEEGVLTRVPVEPIEELLGPGSVLVVERGRNLRELLRDRWHSTVVELFPWLMIAVLLVLAVENLLANKFYRRTTSPESSTSIERNPAKNTDERESKMAVKI